METINFLELKKNPTSFPKVKLSNSRETAQFIRQFYGDDLEIYESFFILMLDNSLNTIAYAKISQGGIVGTVVDVRIVCKYAIESLCSGVVLAHNHPSGSLNPSEQDKNLTKQIVQAFEIMGIKAIDHIILTAENHFSFADNCLI